MMQSESGSVAPLVAGYLALSLLTIVGSAAVGVSMIASNRVQAVADSTLLYAHDRSITRGVPNAGSLEFHAREFLAMSPSVRRIGDINFSVGVSGAISELELCGRVANPLGLGAIRVCKSARAESFIVR